MRSIRSRALKASVVAGLAAAAIAMVAPAANASGTSGNTHGCYAKWWNTAFAGYCTPANTDGYYQLVADCNHEYPYYEGWHWLSAGSWVSPLNEDQCRYHVASSWIIYSG